MATIGKLVVLLIAVAVLLLVVALLRNAPSFSAPPGLGPRLLAYLSTNVAETSDDSVYPELRTPVCAEQASQVLAAVEQVARSMGWGQIERADNRLTTVITTPLWRFKDDMAISTQTTPGAGTRLHLRSASRVGRGDLAANSAYIMSMLSGLKSMGIRCQQ
ncbi:MAG: DUF1499 domain-containing protein [Chromatiales bacterium]|nr:DUF1499 domain-containing protein [Chromatiales bacterium]